MIIGLIVVMLSSPIGDFIQIGVHRAHGCSFSWAECTLPSCNGTHYIEADPDVNPPYQWTLTPPGQTNSVVVIDCPLTGQCNTTGNYPGVRATQNQRLEFESVLRSPWNMEGTWALLKGNSVLFTCQLCIYSKAEAPTCQPPELSQDQTSLVVNCSTPRIYPEGLCKMLAILDGSDLDVQNSSTVAHDSSLLQDYYETECRLSVPLTNLTEGIVEILVTIHPNVQCDAQPQDMGSVVDAGTLVLSLPTMSLQIDACPLKGENVSQGYIKEGSTTSCTCVLAHRGFPQGHVLWYRNATIVTNTSVLPIDPQSPPSVYTCSAQSSLGRAEGPRFSPRYTRGPSTVSVLSAQPVCSGSSVQIICAIETSTFSPDIQMAASLYRPNSTFTERNDIPTFSTHVENDVEYREYQSEWTLLQGGPHGARCAARNFLFPDIVAEEGLLIDVIDPPSGRPVLNVSTSSTSDLTLITDNSTVVNVTESHMINITCIVEEESIPSITEENYTIQCIKSGTSVISVQGTLAMLGDLSMDYDGALCFCEVALQGGCYGNNTSFTIVIAIMEEDDDSGRSFTGLYIGLGVFIPGLLIIVLILDYIGKMKRPGAPRVRGNKLFEPPSHPDVITEDRDLYSINVVVLSASGVFRSPQEVSEQVASQPSTSQGPHSTKQGPPSTSQRPHSTSQRPHNSSQRPHSTSQGPHNTSQRPHSTSQRPHSTSQRLHSTSQGPHNTSQRPHSTSQRLQRGTTATRVDGAPERGDNTSGGQHKATQHGGGKQRRSENGVCSGGTGVNDTHYKKGKNATRRKGMKNDGDVNDGIQANGRIVNGRTVDGRRPSEHGGRGQLERIERRKADGGRDNTNRRLIAKNEYINYPYF